jgi:nitrogen fixation protein FixH
MRLLVHEAISTFGGMEADGSYRAGQLFGREVALAKAQDAQQWRV